MDSDLISVIMPAYNAGQFIQQSINSVIAQTYTNWELIVVDDGSVDQTAAIVKQFQLIDKRIQYYYQPNANQASARNKGLKYATGDYIAFLDADDEWMPEKLESQLQVFKDDASVGLVYTAGYYLYQDTHELQPYDTLTNLHQGAELFNRLIRHNYIPLLSVCCKKEVIAKGGNFDVNVIAKGCEDWDYWLRLCDASVAFYGLETRLFKYRVHSSGTSANTIKMRIAGTYVLLKNYNSRFINNENYQLAKASMVNSLPMILKAIRSARSMAVMTALASLAFKITIKTARLLPRFIRQKLTTQATPSNT